MLLLLLRFWGAQSSGDGIESRGSKLFEEPGFPCQAREFEAEAWGVFASAF